MLYMEGNCRPESPPPPSGGNIGCTHELTRSGSDASSVTAENCKDLFRRSSNVTSDDHAAWTDEKHNLYLHHLEVSFVKKLHQSKCLLVQCSEQNQRDKNTSQKRLINVKNDSEQFNVLRNDSWKNINCERGELLSSSIPADSCTRLKSEGMYNFKQGHPPSAEKPEFLKPSSRPKYGKRMLSHGLAMCSQEFSSNNLYHGELFDLMREGMGQNFLDEENLSTSSFGSQAKRLKMDLADSSNQDQVMSRIDFRRAALEAFLKDDHNDQNEGQAFSFSCRCLIEGTISTRPW